MPLLRISVVLAGLMLASAVAGFNARPESRPPGSAPRYVLEDTVPARFGDWHALPEQGGLVVNPQTQELLDKLYSQVLTRTYVNSDGYQIMLSLAYGDEQRGNLQAHKPEVCYPAQGFALHSNEEVLLATPFGDIAARQLATSRGQRQEPVTYWFTAGDTVVRNKLELRMVEIKMGLTGEIPDGLLFRVSSIDGSPERAFGMQREFAAALLAAVTPLDRKRLSGLGSAASPG